MEQNGSPSAEENSNNEDPTWRAVSLPAGLVDEGVTAACDDEQLIAEAQEAAFQKNSSQLVVKAPAKVSWWSSFNLQQQRTIIFMAVAFVAVFTLLGVVLAYHFLHQDIWYVAWPFASVYEQPSPGMPIGTLQRGESVIKLGVSGEYCQIRDMDGKVGFIVQSHLVEKKPDYVQGSEFYGCRQYLSEDSTAPCEDRAAQQFKDCVDLCTTDISGQCQAQCQTRKISCQAHCTH